ncbi:MAG: ThuA domain-containing protein, partial [Halioglobus sp.]|nr:ThuA domain-containing protein [Halioglobus sp.]
MKKVLLVTLAVAAALTWYWYEPPIPDFGRKVLVFSRTVEYRHASIPKGIATLTELGRSGEFNVEATEDASVFTQERLAGFHAVVFLNTTGDVLNDEQQEAMQRYIQAGGGYVGIHAAADTEWRKDPWYWYQRLVGGVFAGHPKDSDQGAVLSVAKSDAAITSGLPAAWEASDEWYDYQRLSAGVNVLLRVDEATYEGGQMGSDHPVAWYREFDGGRSFYTGLGHTESTYDNEHFRALVLAGLEWAMGDGTLDYAQARPESWRFTRTVLDSNLNEPVKIMFSPEGDLYFIERRGAVKRYDVAAKKSVTVGEVPVFTGNESGMLGMVFDPDYAQNRFVYIYYST